MANPLDSLDWILVVYRTLAVFGVFMTPRFDWEAEFQALEERQRRIRPPNGVDESGWMELDATFRENWMRAEGELDDDETYLHRKPWWIKLGRRIRKRLKEVMPR